MTLRPGQYGRRCGAAGMGPGECSRVSVCPLRALCLCVRPWPSARAPSSCFGSVSFFVPPGRGRCFLALRVPCNGIGEGAFLLSILFPPLLPVPPLSAFPEAFLRDVSPQLLLRGSSWRSFTSQTDGEARVSRVLREKFPRAAAIRVVDISGTAEALWPPPNRLRAWGDPQTGAGTWGGARGTLICCWLCGCRRLRGHV